MVKQSSLPKVDRRSVLKSTAGLGALAGLTGLAGCIGDDDFYDVIAGCSSRGSTSFGTCMAMQSVASDHSDVIEFTATAPGGDPASIRGLSEGELNVRTAGNFISYQAYTNSGPFADDPIEEPGGLVATYITIDMYFMQMAGAGYEDIEDAINQEADIWAFPAGWGLRLLFQTIMEQAGWWDDVSPLLVDMAAEDVPGALEENRIEVLTGYGTSMAGLPGWGVEADARTDLEHLPAPDWYWDAVEQSPAIINNIPPYGWEQSITDLDEFPAWVDGFNMYAHPDLENEAVYEILRLAHEHAAELRSIDPNWLDGSNLDNLTMGFWDQPIHPGAVEFFEEYDHDYEAFI